MSGLHAEALTGRHHKTTMNWCRILLCLIGNSIHPERRTRLSIMLQPENWPHALCDLKTNLSYMAKSAAYFSPLRHRFSYVFFMKPASDGAFHVWIALVMGYSLYALLIYTLCFIPAIQKLCEPLGNGFKASLISDRQSFTELHINHVHR